MTVIFKNLCNIESMNEMTKEFNTNETIKNFQMIFDEEGIDEISHFVTINEALERLDTNALESIRKDMVKEIIRRKTFNNERLLGSKWKVIFDATYLYSFNKRHCEHCLTQTFNRGKENEYTVYSHKVLEAKLILSDDIVISMGTEFIENEEENVTKQDSELKAFKRLTKKIKKDYPRLPICILADSLYAAKSVMEICENYHWDYLIRFKDGSIPTLAKEFEAILSLSDETKVNIFTFEKVNESKEKGNQVTKFKWLTNIKVTEKNIEELVKTGRQRWKIENEGFNTQKNLKYYIKHANSLNYNAMKNHYLITQISDIILQLYTTSSQIIKSLKKSIKKISSDLLKWLTTTILSKEDIFDYQKRTSIHFV
jgi:predicted RNA-binding protein with PIN domain